MNMNLTLLYRVNSAFIILFFPRQLTHLMCFGRHRDEILIKSKKAYWGIYLSWTAFFGILCSMMGAASDIDPTFDNVLYFIDLISGYADYVEVSGETVDDTIYLTYYTLKDIDEAILSKIIQNNSFIYKDYKLEGIVIKQVTKRYWGVYLDGEVMGYIQIKRSFIIKKVCYEWDRVKLESRYEYEY